MKALLLLLPLLAWAQTVKVRLNSSKLPIEIVSMSMEEYVTGVLGGEAGGIAEPEALKAFAVAARSYAMSNRGRHRKNGYDFCDTTHCQDLRLVSRSRRIEQAVEDTAAELIWFRGEPAHAFYHRHCGGSTEAVSAVWPALRAEYLRAREDNFCLTQGKASWQTPITASDLAVSRRSATGRVREVRLDGRTTTFEQFQRWAGLSVRSARFEVVGGQGNFRLQGVGDGHGVGMCQTGAMVQAGQGRLYREILAFYYPDTNTGVTAQGFSWSRMTSERIELWSVNQPERSLIVTAERGLREAEDRSRLPLAGRVKLRVFPTLAAYRHATGEPGWVVASTVNGWIRLQPVASLQARGVLEETLLHEMLHLLIASQRLGPRIPLWFQEGIVLYLEQPHKPGGPDELVEEHLRQPPDEAAMRRAYEHARRRVRSLVDRYGAGAVLSWIERGVPAEVTRSRFSQANSTSR